MDTLQAARVDRFVGAILGTAFGDALGAAVEGWTSAEIRQEFGEVRHYVEARLGGGCYTDDTQLTLATARSIVRRGEIDGADCARACAAAFDPERGYGRSAVDILLALRDGADYRQTGTLSFAEGSYGNGAAMRIAPVGLYCGTMSPPLLRSRVFEAVRATHVHDEAIDGALVVAAVIGRLSRLDETAGVDPTALIRDLSPYCRTMELRSRLMLAARLLEDDASVAEAAARLGNGVRTLDSVPTALFAALRHRDDPEQAVIAAVGCGGDADTIAAMTGAVVGARCGASRFPRRWHDGLERGPDGYDALTGVARELSEIAG